MYSVNTCAVKMTRNILLGIMCALVLLTCLELYIEFLGTRLLHVKGDSNNGSTCSVEAERRGPHQHVVSFSFYGDPDRSRQYLQGIAINAELMEVLFPGWVMRIYHDVSNHLHLSKLFHNHTLLDLCLADNIPALGNMSGNARMMWRFYPMSDPQVDVFISRDLDSSLTIREKMAVDEWLSSPFSMHVMRDHPKHSNFVLGGMWGLKVAKTRGLANSVMDVLVRRGSRMTHYGRDQEFLRQTLWNLLQGDILQHDSYHCQSPPIVQCGNIRPWPSPRKLNTGNFVGYSPNYDSLNVSCPLACRPNDHKDWTLC